MNFLENIFNRLSQAPTELVLQELRPDGRAAVTVGELLQRVAAARQFLTRTGLRPGDRCALVAANSIAWAAFDLAAMAEGLIVVPMYARQAPGELATMMRDCQPRLICAGEPSLRDGLDKALHAAWPDAPRLLLLDETFAAPLDGAPMPGAMPAPARLADNDPVTIIYTSGTSGEAKGVILNAGNVTYMLSCITAQLDLLMGKRAEHDRVFHYLPFCFAGSWLLLLTCLIRGSLLSLSMDLTRIADDLRAAAPDYCQNVPTLLERMRAAIENQIHGRGGLARRAFGKGKSAWMARRQGKSAGVGGALWLALASRFIFPAIRKKLGPNLKALICGSAPLAQETQLFFVMLGIPVLQAYGLTETTGICTMDDPRRVEPGAVGSAIRGSEMKLGEGNEILVRGPHIFPGYWNRPKETAAALAGGWFHTGDQGEQTPDGNWRIIGRLKNLLVLNSGHNVAPEPIEEHLLQAIPGAQNVVVFGHARSYLVALVAGTTDCTRIAIEIGKLNQTLPHYRQIHAWHIEPQPLTIDSGLLTANGKLRRAAIAAHFAAAIDALYAIRSDVIPDPTTGGRKTT